MGTHQKNHCVTVDTHQPWTSTIVKDGPFGSKSHRHACKKTYPMMDLCRGSPWLLKFHTHTQKVPCSSVKTMSTVTCKIPKIANSRLTVRTSVCGVCMSLHVSVCSEVHVSLAVLHTFLDTCLIHLWFLLWLQNNKEKKKFYTGTTKTFARIYF